MPHGYLTKVAKNGTVIWGTGGSSSALQPDTNIMYDIYCDNEHCYIAHLAGYLTKVVKEPSFQYVSVSGGPGDAFTISAWIMVSFEGDELLPIYSESNSAGHVRILLAVERSTGQVIFDNPQLEVIGVKAISSTTVLNEGDWYFITAVQAPESRKLYINGVLEDETSDVYTGTVPDTFLVGGLVRHLYATFHGTIDEFKIFNLSLSPEQIYQEYLAGLSGQNSQVLVSQETSAGEEWHCSVTPNDGFNDGETKDSAKVTILEDGANMPPTITTPTFQPPNPNATSNIECWVTPSDDESPTLTVEYWWYNNSVLHSSGSTHGLENGTLALITTLSSGNTTPGEEWNCTVRSYDGEEYSGYESSLVIIAGQPATYDKFEGDTTDFNNVDIEAVYQPVLEIMQYGKIVWNGLVNASGMDFDSYVFILNRTVTVDISNLHDSFDSSANITLYNTGIKSPVLLRDGLLCTDCELISFDNGNIRFRVDHFTTYSVTDDSNLTIWDSSDPEGGSVEVYAGEQAFFFANYTFTDGTIITDAPEHNGTCQIRYNVGGWTSSEDMEFNVSNKIYFANRSFELSGLYEYNVTCNSSVSAFENSAVDSIAILDNTLTISAVSPLNAYAVDRDAMSADPDYAELVAYISNEQEGITVTFIANLTMPSIPGETNIVLGTALTNSTGHALFTWSGKDDTNEKMYAGNYTWWAEAEGFDVDDTKFIYLYGAIVLAYRNETYHPNSSYTRGDVASIEMVIDSIGPETRTQLNSTFEAWVNSTLISPSGINYTIELIDPGDDEPPRRGMASQSVIVDSSVEEITETTEPVETSESTETSFMQTEENIFVRFWNWITQGSITGFAVQSMEKHGPVRINEPVRWTKTIATEATIPKESFGITSDKDIMIRYRGASYSLEEFNSNREEILAEKSFIERLLPLRQPVRVQAHDAVIEYYMPAPVAVEEYVSRSTKRVKVSSNYHYTNILAFTDITEAPKEAIKVYWLKDTGKELFTDVTYIDANGNGLINRIEWVIPHLSEQIFEISINVLNVQSYPIVGGEWTVMFETIGMADLAIRAVDGTTWSNANEDNDLKLLEIRCGDDVLDYEWIDDTAIIKDYECDETGFETSKVITPGAHYLEFDFGGLKASARNYALIPVQRNFTANETWEVPSGVTSITVEAWGGGGAGGSARGNNNQGGGGGAGGQYAASNITVSAGETFSVVVAPARAGPSGDNLAGLTGFDSEFINGSTALVRAKGGAGGTEASTVPRLGGAGSTTGGIGSVVYAGGSGGDGTTAASGGGGGGAGSTGTGNDGSGTAGGAAKAELGGAGADGFDANSDGAAGNSFGGGGSGARRTNTGGDGGAGFVRITYYVVQPPSISAVAISPVPASFISDINCHATPNDLVNTTLIVEWAWYNNSVLHSSGSTAGLSSGVNSLITALGSGNTTKGETWNCTVRSYDGEVYSNFSSATISIQNLAPEITTPVISPNPPSYINEVMCNATPSDTENSTLAVEWAWYNNSVLHSSGSTAGLSSGVNSLITTLGSGNTTKGETWNCTVRSYDGEVYSNYISATVSIQNLAPEITTPVISPNPPSYINEVMCNATPSDTENSTLAVEWAWYNNSVLHSSGNTTGIIGGVNSLITTLGSGNTTIGEIWGCTVRSYDGFNYSGIRSATVIISSIPPTHDDPFITPPAPNSEDNLTCNWNNVDDPEGDPVTNITVWHRNSQPLLSLYLPFEEGYTYAKDYSGNSNHGDIYGVTLNSTSGIVGGSMEFRGISNPIWGDSVFNVPRIPDSNNMLGITCDDTHCYGAHNLGYMTKVAKNGTVIWGTGGSSPALRPDTNWMWGITCDDEYCYGAHGNGYLTKVAKNGTVIWGTGGSSPALQPDTNNMRDIHCDDEYCYGAHGNGYLTKVAKNGTVIWGTGGSLPALRPNINWMYGIYCDDEYCYGAHGNGYLTKVAKNGTVILGTDGSSPALRPNTNHMYGIACDGTHCYGAHTLDMTKVTKNGTVIWGTNGSEPAIRPDINAMNGIACDDTHCYSAHASGYLTKVAKNGTVIWGTDSSEPAIRPDTNAMNGIACDDTHCYGAHSAGYMNKVTKSGTIVWGNFDTTPALRPSIINNGDISCDDTFCYSLHLWGQFTKVAKNGTIIWGTGGSSPALQPQSNQANAMHCDDEHCYGAHFDGNLTKVAKNGTIIWGTGGSSPAPQLTNYMTGLYCDNEHCYGAHMYGYLTKITKSGTIIWGIGGSSALRPDTNQMSDIYCDNEHCYGAHSSGYLTKVTKSGTIIWGTGGSEPALRPYTSSMFGIYCDDAYCYGAHQSGYLTKVAKNGTIIWGTGGSSPALRPDTNHMNDIYCDENHCYGAHAAGYVTKVAKNGTVIWGTGGSSPALQPQSNQANAMHCDDEHCYGAHDGGYITKIVKEPSLEYISVPDGPGDAFSISVWIKVSFDGDVFMPIYSESNSEGYAGKLLAIERDAGQVIFDHPRFDVVGVNAARSTTMLNEGNWYFITAVQTPLSRKLYINGILEDETHDVYTGGTPDTFTIGALTRQLSRYFRGTMDQFKIYSHSLSSEQIYQEYLAGLSGQNSQVIVSQETNEGEEWYCSVTPNNRNTDGETKYSMAVTILSEGGQGPSVTTPIISPEILRKNVDAAAGTTYTHPENSPGTVFFMWHVNNINVFNQTSSVSSGSLATSTLYHGNYTTGDIVNVSVYASDGESDSETMWSETKTVSAPLPIYDTYDGSTTDFNSEPDTISVDQPVLEKTGLGMIKWLLDNRNVAGADFDTYVTISNNLIEVDSANLHESLNSPANLTLFNLDYEYAPALYRDGAICGSYCTLQSYSGGTLKFNVSGFTGYSSGSNSLLTIWDETDADMPYAGQTKSLNEQVLFFANYTNATSGEIITGAICEIMFNSVWLSMPYNTTNLLYQYNRSFESGGLHNFNVSCSRSGFETLLATDTVSITLMEKFWNNTFDTTDKELGQWNLTAMAGATWFYVTDIDDGRNFTLTSDSVNTAPEITTPTLMPAYPNTTSDIECWATPSDAESSTLTVEWAWYNNSVLHSSGSTAGLSSGVNSLITTLGSGNTTLGEEWNCTLRAYDGEEYSEFESASVIIENTPPTHDAPFITPAEPYDNDELTCNWNNVYDADGDPVTNITLWYKNNVSQMLLYMPFEGGSNSTYTKDYSPYQSHGIVGNAVWEQTGGKIGGYYSFDGSWDYINITTNPELSYNATNFTMMFWINPSIIPNGAFRVLMGKFDGSIRTYVIYLWGGSGSYGIEAYLAQNASTYTGYLWHNPLSYEWTHIAFTFAANDKWILYVNGVNVTEDTTPGHQFHLQSNSPHQIGQRGDLNNNNWYSGSFDELRMFNSTLSASQIAKIYEQESLGANPNVLVADEKSISDEWHCSVTPNDGFSDGETKNSSAVIIMGMPNEAPQITWLQSISVMPNESSTRKVWIAFNATDTNGYEDIDLSSAKITVSMPGEIQRNSTECILQENDADTATINCSVYMYYYDGAGQWTINATVSDMAGEKASDASVLEYGALFALTGYEGISFGSLELGQVAGTSIILNNTGNQDFNHFNITAFDLIGETLSQYIPAESFFVNTTNEFGWQLQNSSTTTLDAMLPRNNEGLGNLILYFRLIVPSSGLSQQNYISGNWIIEAYE
jgi:hypothetical protein